MNLPHISGFLDELTRLIEKSNQADKALANARIEQLSYFLCQEFSYMFDTFNSQELKTIAYYLESDQLYYKKVDGVWCLFFINEERTDQGSVRPPAKIQSITDLRNYCISNV